MENNFYSNANDRKEIRKLENGDYELGNCLFYPEELALYKNGEKIKLQNQSAIILLRFLEARRHFLSRKALIEIIGSKKPTATYQGEDRLDMAISRLRKSLKADAWLEIECNYKVGYTLYVKKSLPSDSGSRNENRPAG